MVKQDYFILSMPINPQFVATPKADKSRAVDVTKLEEYGFKSEYEQYRERRKAMERTDEQ